MKQQLQSKNTTLFFWGIVIIISFLPFFSMFLTPMLPHTHDGLVHIPRIAAFYRALEDGEFPVRWAGNLNYGYGMPLFNFIYQVPYAIASLFVFFGAGLVVSFKVTLFLSFLLSGIFTFLFSKELTGDNKKALLITTFYQFVPFRLVELFIRGSFGEVYAYTFLPLVCYGLVKLSKKITPFSFVVVSISTALLVLSHNALSLAFFAICAGLVFVWNIRIKTIFASFLSLIGGLCLSAYYWVPALVEHKYTYGDLFMQDIYINHFAPIQNFFIPNFFNMPFFQTGGISVQIGLFHTIAILIAIWVLYKRLVEKKETAQLYLYSLLVIVITFFFMQPLSKFVWAHVSLLRQFQFPWRLLGAIGFVTSLLSISLLSFRLFQKNVYYFLLLFFVIFSTSYFWHPLLGLDSVNEKYYWHFPLTTTYYGETDVIWSAGPAKSYPKVPAEFAVGQGTITQYSKKSQIHSYTVDSITGGSIVDHTEFFPGWKAYVNGKEVPVEFQDENWRGQIIFPIARGKSKVQVIFTETKIRIITDIVSLITLIGLCTLACVYAIASYAKKRI